MMKNIDLPFEVGQMAESRTFMSGFRGAWFQCKVSLSSSRFIIFSLLIVSNAAVALIDDNINLLYFIQVLPLQFCDHDSLFVASVT